MAIRTEQPESMWSFTDAKCSLLTGLMGLAFLGQQPHWKLGNGKSDTYIAWVL